MKKAYKISGVFAAVLLYIVLLCLQMHEMAPELENTVASMDITAMGTFLTAENKAFYNAVYEVDSDGEIVKQFYKTNQFFGRCEEIMDISYSGDEDRIYILCRLNNDRNNKVEYRVYRLSSNWHRAEKIGTISKKKAFQLKDFNVVGNFVYLTGVDTKKDKLLVYSLDTEEEKKAELVMERGATKDGENDQNIKWADAAFSGKTLYGLSNRGQLLEYNRDNVEPFTVKDMGEVTWMCGNHNDIVYYDYMEEMFTSIEDSVFLEILEEQQGVITVRYEKDNGYSLMLRRNEAGDKEVLLYEDEEEFGVDKISAGVFSYVKRLFTVAVGLAVIFALVIAVGAALWHFGQKIVKRPVLVTAFVVENAALAVAVCLFCSHTGYERIRQSENVSVITYLTGEQAKCNEIMEEYEEIIPEEFAVAQWFEPVRNLLSDWTVEENDRVSYEIDLVEYRGEESHILYSLQNAYGRNIYGIYPKDVLVKLDKMKNKEKVSTVRVQEGDDCIYAIQFLEENENNHLVWVAKMKIAR